MTPDRGDPTALTVVAYPDARDVIGVVMHVPAPAVVARAGTLTAEGVQLRAVIGAVVDADAVGVDRPAAPGQQLDVLLRAERDRDVPGSRD